MEMLCWCGLLAVLLVLTGASMYVGTLIPNGLPVVLGRHPKVQEGHYYWIDSLTPLRRTHGLSVQYCATLQDKYGLENPFLVLVIPGRDCKAGLGQLAQAIYQDDHGVEMLVLYPVPPNLPTAC